MKSIKNLKPSGNYKSGDFSKYKPKKYYGELPIIYRSGLELSFMLALEANKDVVKWSSEEIVIPYLIEELVNGKVVKKRHNYHTDFTVHKTNGEKWLIEIKPSAFVPMNESQIKRDPTIRKNYFKWKYAEEWCKNNGYKFRVITELNLKYKI